MRWIRVAPVTAEVIIVSATIFLSCQMQADLNGERLDAVQRQWGAIRNLKTIDRHQTWIRSSKAMVTRVAPVTGRSSSFELNPSESELQISGPFDLWEGEWWRIPLTSFHHENFFHLLLCLGAVWYLGSRLERYWGTFAMGLFLVPACCIPMLAELYCGQTFSGLSGFASAMFGALVVLRQSNKELAGLLSDEAVEAGVVVLGCYWVISATSFGWAGYAGHLTGLAYGGFIGLMMGGRLGQVALLRVTIVMAHWMLVPAMFLATYPIWTGRYQWYRAQTVRDWDRSDLHLMRTIRISPNLAGAWLQWAQVAEVDGDQDLAWERLINGLSNNPSSAPLIEASQRLWQHLNLQQRYDAVRVLDRFFGSRSRLWLEQIRLNSPVSEHSSDENLSNLLQAEDLSQFRLDQKIELPSMNVRSVQPLHKAPLIPLNGNDAMEGESL